MLVRPADLHPPGSFEASQGRGTVGGVVRRPGRRGRAGRAPGRGRRLWRLAWLALLVAVAYLGVTFAQVWGAARVDRSVHADAIVVMGAAQYAGRPSPVLAARLDHAVDVYQAGMADVVVVTGGPGAPGDTFSEASSADLYLQQRGVPPEALRLETGGRTSYESLAATARFLAAEGRRDVILISDGWHLRRSAEIANALGLTAHPSPTPYSPYSTVGAVKQMLRETIAVAVGRLIGFRRLDQVSEELGLA